MASVISFREASEKARADARSALARLREERLKSRQAARPRWTPPGQPQHAAPAPAVVPEAAPVLPAEATATPSPAPAPRRKGSQPTTGRSKRIADIVRDATGASPEETAVESAPEAPESGVSLDLSVLSVLGPGLRWRLSQLGIDSLKSLSKADAASLRRELGEIGRLANVEGWIEAARAMEKGGA